MDDTNEPKKHQPEPDPLDQEDTLEAQSEAREDLDEEADDFEAEDEDPFAKSDLSSEDDTKEQDPDKMAATGFGVEDKDPVGDVDDNPTSYFLEVVKNGSKPQWSVPEEDLLIGSQPLPGGYTQYWGYPKDSGRVAQGLPEAEVLAQHHPAHRPAVLIDQDGQNLQLIITKDGHAWGKSESSVSNLEDNLMAILDFAQKKFDLKIENFMTTANVSPEVNQHLDKMAGEEHLHEEPEAELAEDNQNSSNLQRGEYTYGMAAENVFRPSGQMDLTPQHDNSGKGKRVFIIGLALLIIGALIYVVTQTALLSPLQSKIASKLGFASASPSPSASPNAPTVVATPSPAVDRSKFSVRVLNGTSTTGAAGKLADQLKTLGWKIAGDPANATNSAYVRTQVRTKASGQDIGNTLVKDLAPTYDASLSADLKSSDSADAEVVIGKI